MYDGVQTHGLIHALRMEEVFWGRLRILMKVVDLFMVAMPLPANEAQRDARLQAWRDLNDTIYVGKKESREERDAKMSEILKREADKTYNIAPIG